MCDLFYSIPYCSKQAPMNTCSISKKNRGGHLPRGSAWLFVCCRAHMTFHILTPVCYWDRHVRLLVESHFLIDHTSVGLTQAHCNYNAVVMYVLKITWLLTCTLLNSLHTQYGRTPLTIAKSKGHDHIVRLLHEASRQTSWLCCSHHCSTYHYW